MSDKIYVGRRVQSFDSAPQFDGYTKVVIVVDEKTEYSAGNETGRTLTIDNPWGTQAMANNILESIRGFRYQPYTADGAILDPAAELGDGITANGLYSGIFSMTNTFGRLFRAQVSAPSEEELENEYPFVPKSERKMQRKIAGVSAELSVQAGRITANVTAIEGLTETTSQLVVDVTGISATVSTNTEDIGKLTETTSQLVVDVTGISATVTDITEEGGTLDTIQSTLTQHATDISAKVSHTKAGGETENSFGWTLTEDSWTIKANGIDVLVAKKEGLEIEGKITATSGKIGGFDIGTDRISYNKLEWGGSGSGAYIGINGIQLGSNFKLDMSGDLEAYSGKFTGNVYAGSIQYGEETDPVTGMKYGTVSGSALTAGTVTGGQFGAIGSATLTTHNTGSGINTSLGYADYANGVFTGVNDANFTDGKLFLDGYRLYRKTISIDGSWQQIVCWVQTS